LAGTSGSSSGFQVCGSIQEGTESSGSSELLGEHLDQVDYQDLAKELDQVDFQNVNGQVEVQRSSGLTGSSHSSRSELKVNI
jgi:hypothetical protein